MTTELEIIDTAVKVGLGAVISGITTYLMTSRSHKHEVRKELLREKTELLKRGASLWESSGALVNHSIREYENAKRCAQEDSTQFMTEINKVFTDAYNDAREARMIFHLIGNKSLAILVSSHLEAVEKLRQHFVATNLEPNKDFLKENNEERKKARDDFLSALSKALEEIYA